MGVHNHDVYPEVKRLLEIPEDEPIFILRAQDVATVSTIHAYAMYAKEAGVEDDAWLEHVRNDAAEFSKWQADNADRVKLPD